MDLHPDDRDLEDWVRSDIRWFVKDDLGHWVKNGYENDVDVVIARCREELATTGARPTRSERVGSMEEERT